MINIYTDFHTHILPFMDDGPEDIPSSIQIIKQLYEQGVSKIIATSHYYGFNESIQTFLKRRHESYTALTEIIGNFDAISIIPGAEVYLLKNISQMNDLPDLCIGQTKYLLVEFPFEPFNDWFIDEINNITYKFSITPIIAHINRYLKCFNKKDMMKILDETECIFQVNNNGLFSRESLKFILKLINDGYPVVLGSDSHNIEDRAPNFTKALQVLRKKLGVGGYKDFMREMVDYI